MDEGAWWVVLVCSASDAYSILNESHLILSKSLSMWISCLFCRQSTSHVSQSNWQETVHKMCKRHLLLLSGRSFMSIEISSIGLANCTRFNEGNNVWFDLGPMKVLVTCTAISKQYSSLLIGAVRMNATPLMV